MKIGLLLQAKPEVALAKLRKLVEGDRVDVLIGPIRGAVAAQKVPG